MKRRTLVSGLGSLLGGAGAVVGSGAFGFVRADRDLEITVEHDNLAYLGLRQLGFGGRAIEDGTPEQIVLNFPGLLETSDGDGIGKNSVYEFTRDANEGPGGTQGLVEITNQGTNDVRVWFEHDPSDGLEIETFDIDDPDRENVTETNARDLDVGHSFRIGFRFDTHGAELGNYEETLQIIAEER